MQQVNTTCTKSKQDRQITSLPLPTHTLLHIHTHNPHAYTRPSNAYKQATYAHMHIRNLYAYSTHDTISVFPTHSRIIVSVPCILQHVGNHCYQ